MLNYHNLPCEFNFIVFVNYIGSKNKTVVFFPPFFQKRIKWNYFSYILTIHTNTPCFSVYFLLIIDLYCPLKKANDSMTKHNDVSTFDPAQAYPTHSPSPLENPHFLNLPRSKMTKNMLWTFQGSSDVLRPHPLPWKKSGSRHAVFIILT